MGPVARFVAAVAVLVSTVSAAIVCPTEYRAGTTQCIESTGRCFLGYRYTGTTCVLTNCPAGQVWLNTRNACGTAVCPTGYTYSTTAKQCTVTTVTCTGGRVWSTTLKRCVCPSTTIWNAATSKCVTGTCPAGYTRDVAGVCIDRNECSTAGICGCCGTCVNTAGSFQCRCHPSTTAITTRCTCPGRVRKEWRSLTTTEKTTFRNAIKLLFSRGTYRTIVPYHEIPIVMPYGHSSNAFLAWHRWYIYLFENQLRSLGPAYGCIALPYWDWTADVRSNTAAVPTISVVQEMGGTGSSCILDSFFGYLRYPGGQCVSRPFSSGWRPPGPTEVSSGILNTFSFTAVSDRIKGWHGLIHDYIGAYGATMSDVVYSPNDPIFWLHHANVDRLWYQWQKCRGYQGTPPATVPWQWYTTNSEPVSHGFDTRMPAFPTAVTPRNVNSITTLGYSYAKSSFTGTWDVDNVCTRVRRRDANETLPATAAPATNTTNPARVSISGASNNGNGNGSSGNNGNNGTGLALALALGQRDKNKNEQDEQSALAFARGKTDEIFRKILGLKTPPPGLSIAADNANPQSAIGSKLAIAAAAECEFWGKYKALSPEWSKMMGLVNKPLFCQA